MIFPLAANLFAFCIAAAGVWIAGTRLAIYADEIADRKRIGKAFMGFVFLAAATELPELATTITAAIEGNAALVLSNMFGGIAFQTAILAFADAVAARVAL
ncbi:MAG: sodium:calcium antiporter, partial [Hyphomicrobiaceae bacterium]